MLVDRKQSLMIIAYPAKETADEVYHTLRALEKQDKIDIKTAATLYCTESGKLRLKHRPRLTLWKNEFDVGSIGLILASTIACTLAGAVVGSHIGAGHQFERCEAKAFLESNLGLYDSALVILVANSDWDEVQSEVDHFGGNELAIELSAEAEKRLAEIAADEEVVAAVYEEVEIEKVPI